MTGERPYSNLLHVDLKAKVDGSAGDPALLRDVLHELSFRKTGRARSLASRVKALLASPSTDASAPGEANKTSATEPTWSDQASSTDAPHIDLASRYAALRSTFTAEAEILARWGLTSLAPPALRDTVVRYWQDEFHKSGGQHPLGLDEEDLRRDLEALGEEKRG